MNYNELSRKEKQLLTAQYPYKKDKDIFRNSAVPIVTNSSELNEFKENAEKEGVTLMKKKNFVATDNGVTSLIDMVLGDMGEDAYRSALELAKVDLNPIDTVKQLFTIETTRLRKGIEYENELGLGLNQDTQAAMNSLTNMAKVIQEMEEGQKYSLEFKDSLSGMIADMDFEEDDVNNDVIDVIDVEQKGARYE